MKVRNSVDVSDDCVMKIAEYAAGDLNIIQASHIFRNTYGRIHTLIQCTDLTLPSASSSELQH